jgi:hypothetical protein
MAGQGPIVNSSDDEDEPLGFKFVCSLFNDAVSNLNYIMPYYMTMNKELENNRTKVVTA